MDFTDPVTITKTALALKDCFTFMFSSIPAGFLLGCLPLIVGLAVSGIVKIFKNI